MTAERAPRFRAVYACDSMTDVRIIEALARSFEVTVVLPAELGDRATNYWPPRPPAEVHRVSLPGGRRGFLARLPSWLRRHRHEFDVVYVLDNVTAALAANLGRLAGGPRVVLQVGRPTVEYLRCQKEVLPPTRYRLRLVAGTVLVAANERLASAIGAVSDYCAAQCGRHNRNVRSIPAYGVDTEVFAPRWTRGEARRLIGLAIDDPIVMFRSRIAPEKDPDTFLRAIRLLRAEGRQVCALYMGGEIDAFAARARAIGVDVVMRRPAGLDEIPAWYVAADVDVQLSHSEGLGMSPLEALACGTPVVVSDVGGLPEVVGHGRVGALVPPQDPVATARAIAAVLDDPDAAAQQAMAGRKWVEQHFTTALAADAWAELGRSVIAAR